MTTNPDPYDYAAGLQTIAAFVEDGTVVLPHDGTTSALAVFARTRPDAEHWLDLLTDKSMQRDDGAHFKVRVEGRVVGVRVLLYIADDIALVEPTPEPLPVPQPQTAAWLAEAVA